MARKKRRKFPIFLAIIILVIIIFGVMLKWNSGYTQNVSEGTDVYDKFKDAVISGGTVSLSSDDINSFISKSFESQTHKGVTIKKIYVNMTENKIDIKIPVSFKGQDFLVSSKGSLALKDGCLAYLPDSFKVGAIPISKNFVLNKLKAMYSSKFTIETDGIYINKSSIPVTINSVQIKDSNLKIGVEKLKINLGNSQASKIRDELANTINDLNPSDKEKVEAAIKDIEKNPNAVSNVKNQLSGVSNSEVKKIINDSTPQNNEGSINNTSNQVTKKLNSDLIARLSKQLGAAAANTSDAKARELINLIQSQVQSGTIDSNVIRSQAKNLSKVQQLEVQASLSKNINAQDANQLQSMLRN